MKKFYICSGDQPKGPYTIEKLLEHGIEKTDFIWCEGFDQSKMAIDIEELQGFFKANERPEATKMNGHETAIHDVISPEQKEKKRYIILFICTLVAVVLLILYYCIEFLYLN